jgi:hypothetical protein
LFPYCPCPYRIICIRYTIILGSEFDEDETPEDYDDDGDNSYDVDIDVNDGYNRHDGAASACKDRMNETMAALDFGHDGIVRGCGYDDESRDGGNLNPAATENCFPQKDDGLVEEDERKKKIEASAISMARYHRKELTMGNHHLQFEQPEFSSSRGDGSQDPIAESVCQHVASPQSWNADESTALDFLEERSKSSNKTAGSKRDIRNDGSGGDIDNGAAFERKEKVQEEEEEAAAEEEQDDDDEYGKFEKVMRREALDEDRLPAGDDFDIEAVDQKKRQQLMTESAKVSILIG